RTGSVAFGCVTPSPPATFSPPQRVASGARAEGHRGDAEIEDRHARLGQAPLAGDLAVMLDAVAPCVVQAEEAEHQYPKTAPAHARPRRRRCPFSRGAGGGAGGGGAPRAPGPPPPGGPPPRRSPPKLWHLSVGVCRGAPGDETGVSRRPASVSSWGRRFGLVG